MRRKQFLKHSSVVVGGLVLNPMPIFTSNLLGTEIKNKFISKRPAVNQRTFVSKQVELTIQNIRSFIKDEELGWMFENCYPNTLDTTVDYELIDGKPDSFITVSYTHLTLPTTPYV